jgi:hypothetical protein
MNRIQNRTNRVAPGALALLAALTLAAGCDRGLTEPSDAPMPVELELVDRTNGDLLSYVHGSGSAAHWHGSLPVLRPGEELGVNAVFMDVDGLPIPLTGEHSVGAGLAAGSPAGVVSVSPHGDHVDILALDEGSVQIVFHFQRGGEPAWSTPPLSLTVDDLGEGNPSDIDRVELVNRATGEPIAHAHGFGGHAHWHGSLPTLQPGEELEVNVHFRDSEGRSITLGGQHSVGAQVAEGFPEGVVELHPHGDHVDIPALMPGEVRIVFTLLEGDTVIFQAPSVLLTVEG